jgi:hypothetical protein
MGSEANPFSRYAGEGGAQRRMRADSRLALTPTLSREAGEGDYAPPNLFQ